jgi:Bacterial membrane protein YfhO
MARYDDVGTFDSILLAAPYRAILGIAGEPRDFNKQELDGSSLPIHALQIAGVRFVITAAERRDLELVETSGATRLFRVPNPVPRAAFFAANKALFVPRQKTLEVFLSQPPRDELLLPEESREALSRSPASGPGDNHRQPAEVTYSRPSSDEIRLESAAGQAGFVHVLESFDPGWSAQVDGKRGLVIVANGFSMAVPVEAGKHTIRLRYQTDGRKVGWILSFMSASLAGGLDLERAPPSPLIDRTPATSWGIGSRERFVRHNM